MSGWFYAAMLVIGVILFYCYTKTGSLLRCALFTAVTGNLALGALWALSKLIVIPLAATPFTVLISTLLGVPGVLTMLVLHLL